MIEQMEIEQEVIKQVQVGNGTFTLENGVFHLTFKISTAKTGTFAGQRIVSLLTGNDNENDYTGFGILSKDGQSFRSWGETLRSGQRRIWKKNPASPTQLLTVKQLTNCVHRIMAHGNFGQVGKESKARVDFSENDKPYTLWISTRCICCNRPLTNPESVERGIGPECLKKI